MTDTRVVPMTIQRGKKYLTSEGEVVLITFVGDYACWDVDHGDMWELDGRRVGYGTTALVRPVYEAGQSYMTRERNVVRIGHHVGGHGYPLLTIESPPELYTSTGAYYQDGVPADKDLMDYAPPGYAGCDGIIEDDPVQAGNPDKVTVSCVDSPSRPLILPLSAVDRADVWTMFTNLYSVHTDAEALVSELIKARQLLNAS